MCLVLTFFYRFFLLSIIDLPARSCNKYSLIVAVAENQIVTHPNASLCADGNHASTEAILYEYCNAPTDRRLWVHDTNVCTLFGDFFSYITNNFSNNRFYKSLK